MPRGRAPRSASPSIAPFFVPPKLSTSTPDVAGERAQRQAEGCRGVRRCARRPCAGACRSACDVVGDRAELVDGVQRAELGGLRQRDDERLGAVLVAPAPRLAVDELGRELAVVGRHGQELDAGDPLGRAALVDVDVSGGCRDHGAPARQHRLQPDDVGSGAVEHRERLDAFAEVVRRRPPAGARCTRPRRRRPGGRRSRRRSRRAPPGGCRSSCRRRSRARSGRGAWSRSSSLRPRHRPCPREDVP